MKKALMVVLVAVFAVLGLAAPKAFAKEKKAKAGMSSTKEVRWSGLIIRSDKDGSTVTVGKKGVEKVIHYDSSTKWTKGTKSAEMSEYKDGSRVICLGKYNDKGEFWAARIDLRPPY